MAYNVLKGVVEGSVDQHGDQEIGGVKVFKNTISASVFYDTDAQSPCATMKDVAIKELKGTTPGAIITCTGPSSTQANHDLIFKEGILSTKDIHARHFAGSGDGLINLKAEKLIGKVKAENISFGPGLKDIRGSVQVDVGPGNIINDEGLGISLSPASGLSIKSNHLVVDASKTSKINTGGQNLSDQDLLLVTDTSRGTLHSTTLGNLCDNYINLKVPQPVGTINEIQLKGRTGFSSSSKLTYDDSRNTLKVDGKISASSVKIEQTLRCAGAVIGAIKTITQEAYEVEEQDYTILCNSLDNPITVTLPPACNHTGRILNIKKANENKYSIRSFPVAIHVQEGTIDINDKIVMKMNYSSRTLQSDGKNWWVIGTKGT